MKAAFAGTPEFARVGLAAVLAEGIEIPLVLTQPDRPAGRGLRLQASPVKRFALERGLAVLQPRSLREDGRHPVDAADARAVLVAAAPDVLVVAAYGLILPAWLLRLPRLGCINIHASLLPRWRGAAPIQRAIEAGDTETGVTIMQMDEGLDTGAMLAVEPIAISSADSAATLQARLAVVGARLVVETLRELGRGTLPVPRPQPEAGVTYARKIGKDEAPIDWHQPAVEIERRARAFDPFPGASGVLEGEVIKVWRARVGTGAGRVGEILEVAADSVRVACGAGVLELTEMQRPGGRRISAAEFVRGSRVTAGMVFDAAPV